MASVSKLPQIKIANQLQHELGLERYEALLRMVEVGHVASLDVDKMIADIVDKKVMVKPMAGAAQGTAGPLNQNYEAAVYSRLNITGQKHGFEMLKVHRSRDGSKFFVFIVVNDKWVVLEDDELFPSDKLISAMRCLTL